MRTKGTMWKYRALYAVLVLLSAFAYIRTNHRILLITWILLVVLFPLSAATLLLGKKPVLRFEIQDSNVVYRPGATNLCVRLPGIIPCGCLEVVLEYENIVFHTVRCQKLLIHPGRKEKSEYRLPFTSEECGKVRITTARARQYDLLGLISRTLPLPEEFQIVVYPEMSDMEIRMLNSANAQTSGNQYDTQKRGQDVTEVFDMREYQEGDSPKSIHWKLSSKLDKVIIREFGHPSSYQTVILYDIDAPEQKTQKDLRVIQNAVLGFVCSLSQAMVHQNYAHHVFVPDLEDVTEICVENQESHMRLMDACMSGYLGERSQALDELLQTKLENRFSRIILVTGRINEVYADYLSREGKLTVVLMKRDGEESVEKENYEIITLLADHLSGRVRMVEL